MHSRVAQRLSQWRSCQPNFYQQPRTGSGLHVPIRQVGLEKVLYVFLVFTLILILALVT